MGHYSKQEHGERGPGFAQRWLPQSLLPCSSRVSCRCLLGRGARRWLRIDMTSLPPMGYLDAIRGGSLGGSWRRRGRTESSGPAPAGCAVSRCAARLALLPSDHFLSPEPDTDSSQHPGCGARPAHGPRPTPSTPAPPAGGPPRTAQHRLGPAWQGGGNPGTFSPGPKAAHT